MAKRTMGVLKACLAVTVLLLVFLAGMPVFADDGDGDGDPVVPVGGFDVTGYRLENSNDGTNYTGELHRYNSLTVVLDITDSRFGTEMAGKELFPTGRLNTDSFSIPQESVFRVPASGKDKIVVDESGKASYQLRFQNMTYDGVGKTFRCDIFYAASADRISDSANLQPIVSYEFYIHQCVEYVEPVSSDSSDSSSSDAVVKGTGFVLKEASYGQTTVYAGQPFTLTATLLATNGDYNVENVTVGITPAKELSLQDGSSLAYIGTVTPGQSVPAEFKLVPGANVEDGSYTAVIDIKGVDAKTGAEVSAQVSISVPVVQPERFEIFSTQLPSDIISGATDGSGYGTITLVNQGKGAVANVSVDIQGAGLTTEEGKQYVGHVGGGEQKTADFNIMASEPGQVAAKVVVSYENASGAQKELVYDFTLNVEDGGMYDPGIMDPGIVDPGMMEPEPTGMPLWGWILIAVGVIAVVVVVIVILKKRKAKKAAALEDDYDEDE